MIHAVFHQQLAALCEDQGRLAEATVLLRKAASLFRKDGMGHEAIDCLIQLGFLYLQQDDPARAMPVLVEVEERILSFDSDFYLAKVKLGQAMCLAAVGLQELARQVKAESLPARKGLKQKDRVKMEWLECRIAVHLGELDTAIPRLEALCRWFDRHQDLGRLCLCSIDLAYAYLQAGRLQQGWPALVRQVARQPGAEAEVWPLGALWRFHEAVVAQSRNPASAARDAAALVFRRETSLASGSGGSGRPGMRPGTGDLAKTSARLRRPTQTRLPTRAPRPSAG